MLHGITDTHSSYIAPRRRLKWLYRVDFSALAARRIHRLKVLFNFTYHLIVEREKKASCTQDNSSSVKEENDGYLVAQMFFASFPLKVNKHHGTLIKKNQRQNF